MIFVGFIGFAGLAGYYFILKRSLRELDPSRAIPERVKAAFDTLAEGVLILDEQEFVLLANDAQSGPRVQQDSIRSASRFLAERVMLVDERLRFHEERQHSRP